MSDQQFGVWISYYHDGSGFYVHSSELQAYRDSAGYSREVLFLPYNTSISEAETAARQANREAHA